MIPYWYTYVFGSIATLVGWVCLWKGPEFSGWRVLGNCSLTTGLMCLAMTAFFQFQYLFR